MRYRPVVAFLLLFAGVLALPWLSPGVSPPLTMPTATAAETTSGGGLLAGLGDLEAKVLGAKDLLGDANQMLAQGDPRPPAARPRPVSPIEAAQEDPPATPGGTIGRTFFEWDCPDEAEEHDLHQFSIMTDAKFVDPKVERRGDFDAVQLFGPVVTTLDEDQDNQPDAKRLLEWAWTGKPAADGSAGVYRVEVVTFDPDKGITRHQQKVEITATDPPPTPIPPGGTPGGYGLASQVPAWLATVPAAARGDVPKIKEALATIAAAAPKFKSVADMQAALGVSLTSAMANGSDWKTFGGQFNAAMVQLMAAGKITTPAEYGQALLEVKGAL